MGRPAVPAQIAHRSDELFALGIPRVRAELGARVGTLRFQRGWSWTELGKAASVSWKQVQEIESGERDPSFSTIVKLAKALEIRSLDELVGLLPLDLLLASSEVASEGSGGEAQLSA